MSRATVGWISWSMSVVSCESAPGLPAGSIASCHRSKSPPSRVDANTTALPSGFQIG
jgi:hypothetical protein